MGILGDLFSGGNGTHRSFAERYTEPTRCALQSAREEAQQRGATEITVADLLAGLMVEEGSRAERVGMLKSNAFYLRWLTGLPALPALRREGSGGTERNDAGQGSAGREGAGREGAGHEGVGQAIQIEPDFETRRALAFAVLEADRDREYWIDSDHVLRGLLRFANKADFALLKTELNLDAVRAGSRKDREEFPPHQNPNLKVVKYLVRKYATLLVPTLLSLACYLVILFEELGIGLTAVAH